MTERGWGLIDELTASGERWRAERLRRHEIWLASASPRTREIVGGKLPQLLEQIPSRRRRALMLVMAPIRKRFRRYR